MNDQQLRNQQEWENADNWSGAAPIGIYFSKADSRLWVPKRVPAFGWTINLGHSKGALTLFGIILGLIVLLVTINAFALTIIAKKLQAQSAAQSR